MAAQQQPKQQVLEIAKPTLQSNERIVAYVARATSCVQDKGHVGTKGPFVGFDEFNAKEWPRVVEFINRHKDQPYCAVYADIAVKTVESYGDGLSANVTSYRYHDVFLKDDSLLLL